MSNVTGIIQSVSIRSTSAGEMSDITVAGQRYGAGLARYLKAKEGDYVTFEVEERENGKYKNVKRNTLKISKNKPPAEALEAAKATAKGSFDARQEAISRQAASNTAIAWVSLLQSAGAIEVPAAKAKSKGGLMAYYDLIRREYEKEFYEHNTGNAWTDISPKSEEEVAEEVSDAGDDAAVEDDLWE